MTKAQAIDAYRRVYDWERRQCERLNATILRPHFSGCGCRMHNCLVNWETGNIEGDVMEHFLQAQLAKEYNHRQRRIWDTANRLQRHFAKMF
jgi:hypothetical protein